MIFSLFLFLTKSEISFIYPNASFGDFRLNEEQGISFNVSENETIYLSTQKYIYNGNIEVSNGESIAQLYNKSRIFDEPFNLTNTVKSGVTFVGFYWRMNDTSFECKRSYSIVNKNSAEIRVNTNETDYFCYFFSFPADKVEIEVEEGSIDLFSNENEEKIELEGNQTINLTIVGKSTSFVIVAKNGTSVNIKGSNNLFADFDSYISQFYDAKNYSLADDDPSPDYDTKSYIEFHGRVAWWIWTLLFGLVGLYVIIFIIAGCGAPKNNNDVPLYYWVTSEYLPMATLLTEKDTN